MTNGTFKLLSVAALTLLAACDPQTNPVAGYVDGTLDSGKWRQADKFPEADVESIDVRHFVTFDQGAASLNPKSRERLQSFVARTRKPYTENVAILVGRDVDPRSLTAQRVRTIAKAVREAGLEPRLRETPALDGAEPSNDITVTIEQVIVIPADCTAGPHRHPLPPKTQAPEKRYGCATTNNLAHMLADPRDLKQGRSLTPGDGEMLGLGVRRYRTDKIKEFDQESTKNQAQ